MVSSQSRMARLRHLMLLRWNNRLTLEGGFTLAELLVVIVIVTILFGIAAPGWLGFMNRQRVSGAKTEVLQVMREAQKLAITKRRAYNVDLSNAPAEVAIFPGDGTNNVTPVKEYLGIGQRDGGKAEVQVSTLPAAAGNVVIFDFDGRVREFGTFAAPLANSDGSIYKVVISPENGSSTRSCVIIDTILGAMSEGSGGDCDA